MEQCEKNGISISELVLRNEESLRTPEEVRAGIAKINRIMQSSIDRGMHARGILPGGLNIKRRAAGIYERLEEKFRENDLDPLMIVDWINLWGFAVAEENASGGQIVTAPTMGSAGIIPSVMRYYERFAAPKSPYEVDEGIVIFLTTASAIWQPVSYQRFDFRRRGRVSGRSRRCLFNGGCRIGGGNGRYALSD